MEKVYVLLSTYNGESFLDEQLQSLKKQCGVKTHLLIRDDGSSDKTLHILKKWKDDYPEWITLEVGQNIGFLESFSRLLHSALQLYPDAQYFAFCDQDDFWLDKKLLVAVSHLKFLHNKPALYFSNLTVVDRNLQEICPFWKPEEVQVSKHGALVQNFAPGCTEVFNRNAAEIYMQHYSQEAKFHDYLMYILCVFLGTVIYDKHSYILYRQHTNNIVGRSSRKQRYLRFFNKKMNKHTSYQFALFFLTSFKSLLTVEDVLIISELVNYRSNIWSKLSLLFNNKIKFTNFESNVLLKIKILMGWV